jgi:hypothetical protein
VAVHVVEMITARGRGRRQQGICFNPC